MNAVLKFLVIWIMRTLNWIDRTLYNNLGVKLRTFSRERLMTSLSRAAKQEVAKPELKPHFDLLTSMMSKKNLTFFGVTTLERNLARQLDVRARMLELVKKEPTILETSVRAPVVIMSLQRTGSSFFHQILSQDPQFKAPAQWEMMRPLPPPTTRGHKLDPRRSTTADHLDIFYGVNPTFKTVHELNADLPDDNMTAFFVRSCVIKHTRTHLSDWTLVSEGPTAFADHVKHLEFLKLQLQVIGWQQGMSDRRFVIMDHFATMQLGTRCGLDAYLKVFPDATFVQTVRNLEECTSSMASLDHQHLLYMEILDKNSKHEIGKNAWDVNEWFCQGHMNYVQRCKDLNKPTRITSVAYKALMADPLGAIEALYKELGTNLSAEIWKLMGTFINNRPRNKLGRHEYTTEEFGLRQMDLGPAMKEYTKLYL